MSEKKLRQIVKKYIHKAKTTGWDEETITKELVAELKPLIQPNLFGGS